MEYNLHPPDGDYCLYIKERDSRINSKRLEQQSSHCSGLEAGGGGAAGCSHNVKRKLLVVLTTLNENLVVLTTLSMNALASSRY